MAGVVSGLQVLLLDDWGLTPLTPEGRRDLLEVIDDRHGRAATVVTSQLPVPSWHEWIADPTLGVHGGEKVGHGSGGMMLLRAE